MLRARRALVALCIAGASLIVLVASASARVASGGTPVTCGSTIYSNLTLQQNLDCSGYTGSPAIEIGSDHVTLNLGGHTLKGPGGAEGTDGIDVISHTGVTIRNGTIRDFDYDVYFDETASSTAQNLALFSDGGGDNNVAFEADDSVGTLAKDLHIHDSDEGVYFYQGSNNTMTKNDATNVRYAFDDEYTTNDVVSKNTSTGGREPFYAYEDASLSVSKNTASGASSEGFFDEYSNGNSYSGNTSSGSGSHGFYLYPDGAGPVTFVKNTSKNNGGDGVYVYYAYYESCDCPTDAGSTFSGNTADNNEGYGFYDYYSINSLWSKNSASGNTVSGFNLDYPQNDVITGNKATGNTDTGIYLEDNDPSDGYNAQSFTKNSAQKNGYYGFYADYPQTASENKAKQNVPYDCWNIACQAGAHLATAPATLPHASAPVKPAAVNGAHTARHHS
jgi:parallel beta-helix repeat protein